MRVEWRTLVTGGSGFVGINLVEALRRSGRTVLSTGTRATSPPGQDGLYARIDLLDRRAVMAAFADFQPQEVVHLAARTDFSGRDDFHGWSVNVLGTCNLIAAITATPGARRALFVSSIVAAKADEERAEYGYARSKAAMEAAVSASRLEAHGCTWAVLRPGHVWGPWGGAPYLGFFRAIARGHYVELGRTDAPKRLAYVGNVVHQFERLLDAPPAAVQGRLFYLADDPPLCIGDWAAAIARALGRPPPPRIPTPFVWGGAFCGDLLAFLGWNAVPLSTTRLRNMRTPSPPIPVAATIEIAGPSPFTLEAGIAHTLTWLGARGLIPTEGHV